MFCNKYNKIGDRSILNLSFDTKCIFNNINIYFLIHRVNSFEGFHSLAEQAPSFLPTVLLTGCEFWLFPCH